jgi:hypothetical protein
MPTMANVGQASLFVVLVKPVALVEVYNAHIIPFNQVTWCMTPLCYLVYSSHTFYPLLEPHMQWEVGGWNVQPIKVG